MTSGKPGSWFARFARACSIWTGRPAAFVIATLVVVVWGFTGPLFDYSDTWQLIINTGTSVATFLMVFLIQSSQNRDTAAMELKLDEVIRALKGARNSMLNLEDLEQDELDAMRERYLKLAEHAKNIRTQSGQRRLKGNHAKSDR